MKQPIEKRKASGVTDHIALAFTTWGVGYIPGAPGTYGSLIGVGIYLGGLQLLEQIAPKILPQQAAALGAVLLFAFVLIGIWASDKSIPLLGNNDPSEAVVDEVAGQLVTFFFLSDGFSVRWQSILVGFLLFRLFDIWKPYPIDDLQHLPGGLGICADDIVAGVYAGICLSVIYAFSIYA
jgi:phosphatidylglycerophosphatase A